jgi:hypothetical protein
MVSFTHVAGSPLRNSMMVCRSLMPSRGISSMASSRSLSLTPGGHSMRQVGCNIAISYCGLLYVGMDKRELCYLLGVPMHHVGCHIAKSHCHQNLQPFRACPDLRPCCKARCFSTLWSPRCDVAKNITGCTKPWTLYFLGPIGQNRIHKIFLEGTIRLPCGMDTIV